MTLSPAAAGDLSELSDAELEMVERQAGSIARDATGVAEILVRLARDVAAERQRRAGGSPEGAGEVHLEEAVGAPPDAVIVDQREAMLRAYALREDASLSAAVRAIWAVVVDRLAALRREAKTEVARQRLAGEAPEAYLDLERSAQETARRLDAERAEPVGGGPSGRPADPPKADRGDTGGAKARG